MQEAHIAVIRKVDSMNDNAKVAPNNMKTKNRTYREKVNLNNY